MLSFTKMHGTGNDFVLLDARALPEHDWPALARAMCDRHFGVGADGMILILHGERAPFRMRIFNPDGSEAEMCGNGIRCFARYLVEHGLAGAGTVQVETLAGLKRLDIDTDGRTFRSVAVGMGAPRLRPEEIPVLLPGDRILEHPLTIDGWDLRITAVSMGNPHAVAFVDDVTQFPLEWIGPQVEHHPLFPARVNFEVATIRSPRQVAMRVWERGAGLTLACGTGACATVVAGRLLGRLEPEVEVHVPGGVLTIRWDGEGEVVLRGPAETVFEGTWLR
jgi:diaminopimelate epimerase